MKNVTIILFLAIIIASCGKDVDDVINVELEGKWVLTNASCYCGFNQNTDFSVHKITFEGSNLTVSNSGEPQFLLNASGSYTVNGNKITLKTSTQYTYVIEGTTLKLTLMDNPDIADDELTLKYVRN